MRLAVLLFAPVAYAQYLPFPGNVFPVGGGSSIQLVSHGTATANGSGATATTGTIACTGANLYAVGVAASNADVATVSDGQSHTYTRRSTHSDSVSSGKSALYIVENITGGSTTFSVTADFPSIYVACFKNTSASGSFDAATGTSNAASNGASTVNCGTLTPASSELILDMLMWFSTAISRIDNGYMILDNNTASSGNFYGGALAYKVATGSQSPNWSVGSGNGSCDLATFK